MPDPGLSADAALSALLEALDEGVLVFDEAQRCRVVGRRVAEIFGVDARTLLGQHRRDLVERLASAAADPDAVRALTGEPPSERTVADPIVIARPELTLVWTSVPIPGPAGPVGRVDVLRDVTRERRAEAAQDELQKRLEVASTVDDLTGLLNRRRFEEDCHREHRRAQREWVSYAIARIDVDGMTALNDAAGRPAGDDLLRKIGEALRSARREYDLVARWVDDEFVLLLPRADALAARKVIARTVGEVHDKARAIAPQLTVCVGAAIWTPPSAEGAADTLRRAGEALARARAKGPGSTEIDAAFADWKDDADAT
jgi:diguanylate cyclase (GGDEF)-like protein